MGWICFLCGLGLLAGIAMVSDTRKKDRRFRTGYKDNAVLDRDTQVLGVKVILGSVAFFVLAALTNYIYDSVTSALSVQDATNPSESSFMREEQLAADARADAESRAKEAALRLESIRKESDELFFKSGGVSIDLGDGVTMRLIPLPPGQFLMGSSEAESDRQPDEYPHLVTITKPFLIGQTEVTQAQWQAVMKTNPSHFTGDESRPADSISWAAAKEFCRRLSTAAGMTIRLPTEAEWEYACRAGASTAYSYGDGVDDLGDFAWFAENSGQETHPTAMQRPNRWGLHDMHGNVSEWCEDWYGDYARGTLVDPQGSSNGDGRVLRGGNWSDVPDRCRSAYRRLGVPNYEGSDRGFRIVAEVPLGG